MKRPQWGQVQTSAKARNSSKDTEIRSKLEGCGILPLDVPS